MPPNLVQYLCEKLIRTVSSGRISLNQLDRIATETDFRDHFLATAWGDATPLERLVSLTMVNDEGDITSLEGALARFGIMDKMRIRQSLEMLELGSLLERRGTQLRFVLSQFPLMARRGEDLPTQIDALLCQIQNN